MGEKDRISLIEKIEETRKSRFISFITSDRINLHQSIQSEIVPIIHEHLLTIPKDDRKKIDLFLYSRGGSSDIPWTLVSMVREYCESGGFSVLIPFRCHSAATMIAIGADEIVMGKKAELGPIDITLTKPNNPRDDITKDLLPISVEDVMGYFSLPETIGLNGRNKVEAFNQISSKINPLALGAVNRSYEQTKLVAKRLLESRAEKMDEKSVNEVIKRIASEIYSHNHAINRSEAIKEIGLKHCVRAEDQGLEDILWDLYVEYRDLFDLNTVFDPNTYLIENDIDEYTWTDLPIACVESKTRLDIQTKSVRINKIKNIPPKVHLELSNLQMPQINIPQLPQGINQQQWIALVEQTITQAVNQVILLAAENSAKQFINCLPPSGFQRMDYAVKWNSTVR